MWVNRNMKRQVTKWEKISENSYSKHTNNKNKSIRKDKIGMQFYNWLKNLNRSQMRTFKWTVSIYENA